MRHMFRRTLASLFIAEGVDVKTVQESFRHSTSKITLDLYAQAVTSNKLAAKQKLIETIIPKEQQPTLRSENHARIVSAFNQQNHPGFVCASCDLEQTRCATEVDRDDHSQRTATHPLSRAQFLQAISKPLIHSDYPLIPNGLERVLKPLAGENLLLFLSVPTAATVLFSKLLKGMVPRDGVEPPTPAFSGLRSTT